MEKNEIINEEIDYSEIKENYMGKKKITYIKN